MDQTLAALYGTNQEEADVEKLAAAELAEKLAADESIDMSEMSDEDLEAVAQDVLNQSAGEEAEVEAAGDEGAEVEEPSQEDLEKISEADYLGRLMAHAFVQESREIEKQAESLGDEVGAKEKAKRISRQAESTGGGKGAVQNRKINVKSRIRLQAEDALKKGKGKAIQAYNATKAHAGKAVAHVKKYPGRYGAALGGAAALGGGLAYAKKHASALDTLVAQRAQEILDEVGATSEKTAAGQYEQLEAVVEQRALELLKANGYEIEVAGSEE